MTQDSLNRDFASMILSASGWRKVFAQSADEEDSSPDISEEDCLICTAASEAISFCLNLNEKSEVLLGRDARPTGPAICEIISRTLQYRKVKVSYAGICSAPEIMAQSTYGNYDCFIYVSASHNPVGHNGIKVGKNGGVFNAASVNPIIGKLRSLILDMDKLMTVYNKSLDYTVAENNKLKAECLENYLDFVRKTTSPDGNFKSFIEAVKKCNIGVVADLNGSARALSIDKKLFEELGVKTCFINDTAGKISHGIVPEGKNLETCCKLLEKMHTQDSSFVLGYVPDNDGDRGNLVYTGSDGKARIMKAQDVFALCVDATLSYHNNKGTENLAVAVNCATSMRIDELAAKHNAKVFRAEVGEANVVELASDLRKKGYSVPILGEGSNGGNITHPAKVRDPMNTLMCMFRLLQQTDMETALKNIPEYTTTDSFSDNAKIRLITQDYRLLKATYEKNFSSEWESEYNLLKKYGIESYLEYQTDGTAEYQQTGNGNKGGLRMVFFSKEKNPIASVWMRPSGTEPLFRIQADVRGNNPELHDELLRWQKSMILKATGT